MWEEAFTVGHQTDVYRYSLSYYHWPTLRTPDAASRTCSSGAAQVPPERHHLDPGDEVSDSVSVDAKRILLRYGAPINVLDDVSEPDRVELARTISRTTLADRETVLWGLLRERGFLEGVPDPPKRKRRKRS